MTEKRIEIVAIGEKHDYSVGAVIINDKGDIYVVHKIIDCDLKTSRHASGQRHWKLKKYTIFEKLGKTTEISKFKGYE